MSTLKKLFGKKKKKKITLKNKINKKKKNSKIYFSHPQHRNKWKMIIKKKEYQKMQ